MKKENPLIDKSLLFAARIIKLNKYHTKEKHEAVISKQILEVQQVSVRTQTKQFTESVKQILSPNSKFHSKKLPKLNIGFVYLFYQNTYPIKKVNLFLLIALKLNEYLFQL